MNIIVFKAGRVIGPLNLELVANLLARGEVSENDLAQRDDIDVWIPLRRLLPPKAAPTHLDRAIEIVRGYGLKFWTALHFNPLRIGLACLLTGCVLIIFPRWTFLLFVPALVASVFAGAILLTRRRVFTGAFLSASALILPAVFLLAGRDDARNARAFPPAPSPSIDSVIPPSKPRAFLPKATPPTSLGGLALPQPVKPTPTPRPAPPI